MRKIFKWLDGDFFDFVKNPVQFWGRNRSVAEDVFRMPVIHFSLRVAEIFVFNVFLTLFDSYLGFSGETKPSFTRAEFFLYGALIARSLKNLDSGRIYNLRRLISPCRSLSPLIY
jgi:hypothetical protein